MNVRRFCLPFVAFAAFVLAAGVAWAEGFGLGETKEQLNLKYDVSAKDHSTGRVTVVLTLKDEGRLKPLNSVHLVIPSDDGTNYVDLSISLALKEEEGKRVARIHLKKDLAERAEIQFRTGSLDGKQEPLTWYYHSIPLAKLLKKEQAKKD